MFSRKLFLLGTIFGCIALFVFLITRPDGKLHIVFCDVGQGDASYIRTPGGADMLIDGGPNQSVLLCLGRHMPFWDRRINVVVVTHPQKDHVGGIDDVLARFGVDHLVIGPEGADTADYQTLRATIANRATHVSMLYAGDTFDLGKIHIRVLWPSRQWIGRMIDNGELTAGSSSVQLASGQVLGYQTRRDLNDFSYYMKLTYGTFDALFTGDGDMRIQPDILADSMLTPVEVLKFPHHGSKTGILPEFLDAVKPDLAVISVGKNSYGHPSIEALELLGNRAIKIQRTDRDGDVEIVSDGTVWQSFSYKQ